MQVLKDKKADTKKLLDFGFEKKSGFYIYETKINNGTFVLNVQVKLPNLYKTVLKEIESGEVYVLHLTNISGDFVGKVREEYNKTLQKIEASCFDMDIFKSKITKNVIKYVNEKYATKIEYLWEKFPDNAIARRKDNKKWYLVIMTIQKSKLKLIGDEKIEIIDLRINPKNISEILKKNNVYPAWHMNKKSWVTIILDGSMRQKDVFKMIDESYNLAE